MFVKTILQDMLDFVFVPHCFGCGEILTRPGNAAGLARCFCTLCMESINLLETPKCVCCAEAFDTGDRDHLCSTCLTGKPAFCRVGAPYEYGGPMAQAILRYKFQSSPFMAAELGRLMTMTAPTGVDLVVPVPLHSKRLAQRGYNQAALLAKVVANGLNVPIKVNLLRRVGQLESQVGKQKKERIQNMVGAFQVSDKKGLLRKKKILLVDDVVTTTATIRAAAKELKKNGRATRIEVLCLARA